MGSEDRENLCPICRARGKERRLAGLTGEDMVRTRIKVGVPVRVHYVGEGDAMLVDRVTLDED